MTPICTCPDPRVKVGPHGGHYCTTCGYTYSVEHGSVTEEEAEKFRSGEFTLNGNNRTKRRVQKLVKPKKGPRHTPKKKRR